jgi:hypothetical protein
MGSCVPGMKSVESSCEDMVANWTAHRTIAPWKAICLSYRLAKIFGVEDAGATRTTGAKKGRHKGQAQGPISSVRTGKGHRRKAGLARSFPAWRA